jgi:Polyketide synthase dehydratase
VASVEAVGLAGGLAGGGDLAEPGLRGRFLGDIRLYRPGAELVADSLLSPDSDPYLADYRIEGWAVLPAVMGLEAMAQAACAIAGQPMLRADQVSFGAPVLIRQGTALIRVCAKREGKRVMTVLRSQQAGQWVDHCQASFQACAAENTASPPVASWRTAGTATEILDSTDLYGSIYFQTGRFRRVAFLSEFSSRRCRALVRGGDEQPWFGAGPGSSGMPLLLGSPGLNDATLHALQACFPHRRVLPAGCDSISVSGRQVHGAVEVRAAQRSAAHTTSAQPCGTPGLLAPDEYIWDVTAVDAAGQVIVSWTGLRLKDAGPVPGNPVLPPALLGVYLERGATALGLDPALRITVRREQPPFGLGAAGASWSPVISSASRRGGWVSAGSRGQLDELALRLRAASPAACAWQTADLEQGTQEQLPDAADKEFETLRARLRDSLAEPTPTVHARIRTAIECLSKAGRPVGCDLIVDGCYGNGWALMHAGDALIACTSVRVIGVSCPVVVSIMAGTGARAAGAA